MQSEDLGTISGSLPHCEMLAILAKQMGLVFCKTGERKTLWVNTEIK